MDTWTNLLKTTYDGSILLSTVDRYYRDVEVEDLLKSMIQSCRLGTSVPIVIAQERT